MTESLPLHLCRAVVDLVEGPPGYGTAYSAAKVRLKDQPAWVAFYNAVRAATPIAPVQVPTQDAPLMSAAEYAPWMAVAGKNVGVAEVVGPKHNPKVVGWLTRFAGWIHDDETAWCAGFANSMLAEVGIQVSKEPLRARGFEDIGRFRALESPRYGCIVTYHDGNPKSGRGHVHFYLGQTADGKRIRGRGGNQGNKVSDSFFPASRRTGYWWPRLYANGKELPLPPKTPPIILRDDGSPVPTDR